MKFAFGLLALVAIDSCAAASAEQGCWASYNNKNHPCSANFSDAVLDEIYYYFFNPLELRSRSTFTEEWKSMKEMCKDTEIAVNGTRLKTTTVSLNSLDEAKFLAKTIYKRNYKIAATLGPLQNLRFKLDILIAKDLRNKWSDNSSVDFISNHINLSKIAKRECIFLMTRFTWIDKQLGVGRCRVAKNFASYERSWVICKARQAVTVRHSSSIAGTSEATTPPIQTVQTAGTIQTVASPRGVVTSQHQTTSLFGLSSPALTTTTALVASPRGVVTSQHQMTSLVGLSSPALTTTTTLNRRSYYTRRRPVLPTKTGAAISSITAVSALTIIVISAF